MPLILSRPDSQKVKIALEIAAKMQNLMKFKIGRMPCFVLRPHTFLFGKSR